MDELRKESSLTESHATLLQEGAARVADVINLIRETSGENSTLVMRMNSDFSRIVNSIQNISAATEEISASVEEVHANAEEMTDQVQQVSGQVVELTGIASVLHGELNRIQAGLIITQIICSRMIGKDSDHPVIYSTSPSSGLDYRSTTRPWTASQTTLAYRSIKYRSWTTISTVPLNSLKADFELLTGGNIQVVERFVEKQ